MDWAERELPILRVLVEHLDDPTHRGLEVEQIVQLTGLEEIQVTRGLYALATADPPFIVGDGSMATTYPETIRQVTERARRAVGQWPTGEQLVDQLLDRLRQAADDEPDPERRGRLHQATMLLGGGVRDVFIEVASAVVTRSMGL